MRDGGRKVNRSWLRAAAAAVALAALSGCAGEAAVSAVEQPAPSFTGTVTDPPIELPAVTLVGADDRSFDLQADTRAPVTLFVFAYTNCPDECPLTVANITVALSNLPPELRRSVDLVVVSADPTRDTPAVLRTWLDRFDPAYRGVTGDPAVIGRLAADLFVPLDTADPPRDAARYDVSHGVQIFAFGADDQSLMLWGSNPTSSELAADLRALVEQQQGATSGAR